MREEVAPFLCRAVPAIVAEDVVEGVEVFRQEGGEVGCEEGVGRIVQPCCGGETCASRDDEGVRLAEPGASFEEGGRERGWLMKYFLGIRIIRVHNIYVYLGRAVQLGQHILIQAPILV